jgi:hypothetical protein
LGSAEDKSLRGGARIDQVETQRARVLAKVVEVKLEW